MSLAATALRLPAESASSASDETVRVVRQTLKGPVMDILRRLVPELGAVPKEEGYDHTLGHLPLLDKCFKAFRENRHQFNEILTDKLGRVVSNDTGLLACGHNLEVVVAMVVRTSAKRYFRRHVGLHKTPKWASEKKGLLSKVKSAIGTQDKPTSLAEELYDCIKAYLLFEWQVPLVPTYAKLSPAQVSSLGVKILKYKEETSLAEAAGLSLPDKKAPLPKSEPAPTPVARSGPARPSRPHRPFPMPMPDRTAEEPVMTVLKPPRPQPVQPILGRSVPVTPPAAAALPRQPQQPPENGKKLSGASFANVLGLPQVQAAIDPILHGNYSIRIIDLVGSHAWADLILILGIRRKDQLAVLILNAFGALGPQDFNRVFGNGANPALLDRLLEGFDPNDINPESSISDIISFVAKTFTPHRLAGL